MNSEFPYSKMILVSMISVLCVTVPYAQLTIALLIIPFSLIDRQKAIFSLFILVLIKISNTALVGNDPMLTSIGWTASIIASFRIWIDVIIRGNFATTTIKLFLLFIFTILCLSLFSLSPQISILKICAFGFIAGAVLLGLKSHEPDKFRALNMLYASWAAVLITSVPTLLVPAIGFFRDGQGFQGSLNHPQGLGVFVAPIVAFLIAVYARRPNFRTLIFLILVVGVLVMTRARTGFAALLLASLILTFYRFDVFWPWLRQFARRPIFPIFLVLVTIMSPVIYLEWRSQIQDFIFKSASESTFDTAFDESRGFLINQALINIEKHPWTGIGFGIASSDRHDFAVSTDNYTGIPTGAPTEKANLAIAVVEETGLLGTLVFLLFLMSFLKAIANCSSVPLALAALTAICTNISEVTFFSMGGLGAYTWIICAVAMMYGSSQSVLARNRSIRHSYKRDLPFTT